MHGNILNNMFQIARQEPYLTRFASDFLVHDVQVLMAAKKGDVFAWGIRPDGTHIFNLLGPSNAAHNVRGALQGFKDGKYFEGTKWFLIVVEGAVAANETIGREPVNYQYPWGFIDAHDVDDVLERYDELAQAARAGR